MLSFAAAMLMGLSALAQGKTEVALLLGAQEAAAGDTVLAGIHFQLRDGWHTYWRNGGDAAMPPTIQWELPNGIEAQDILWPQPEKYDQEGIFSYIYHDEAVLLVPLKISPEMTSGPVELKAEVDWLECEKVCVPQKAAVQARLTVGAQSRPSADAERLAQWQAKVPPTNDALPLKVSWQGEAVEDEREFAIELADDSFDSIMDFYPLSYDDFEVTGETKRGDGGEASRAISKNVFKYDGKWPEEIGGVVVLRRSADGDPEAFQTTLRFGFGQLASETTAGSGSPGAPATPVESTSAAGSSSLVKMLIFAFLGGLILNLMPCVLPVIALKILGFVNQSKESPARVRQLGIVYGIGVLCSFLVLAGVVIGVQSAGNLASWGLQFSNPVFLLCLTVLVTLVALNLFGVFEVTLSADTMGAASSLAAKEGNTGAFFNGVLATTLATPCTAPFLGLSLGYAFSQPPPVIVLMFLTVGAGLAFPYVLLSWNPKWLKIVPKPGPWMEKFKVAMGFPMLATAVWLLSLGHRHFGEGAALWVGFLLVLLALTAWIWGQFVQRGGQRRWLGATVCALLLVFNYVWIAEGKLDWRAPSRASRVSTSMTVADDPDAIQWQPWSTAAVLAARESGRPVFVDFTADWCVTCQVNKKSSIEVDSVMTKLKEIDAVTFRGDNTLQPPEIVEEIRRHGRAGVPLVLVYAPEITTPPIVLPEFLTPGLVLDALGKVVAIPKETEKAVWSGKGPFNVP